MKIIFLDVDGVLNCQGTKAVCNGIMGISDRVIKTEFYSDEGGLQHEGVINAIKMLN